MSVLTDVVVWLNVWWFHVNIWTAFHTLKEKRRPHTKTQRRFASVSCRPVLSCYLMNDEWCSVGDRIHPMNSTWNWELYSHPTPTFWTQTGIPVCSQSMIATTVKWHFDKTALIRLQNVAQSQIPHRSADGWEVLVRRQPVQVFLHEQQ